MSTARIAIYLVSLVGMAPMLHAAVSERDFLATGDGLLTYDDLHSVEWLDLTESIGFDQETIVEAIRPGGSLHGFSVATRKEFEGLAISANLEWIDPESLIGIAGAEAGNLVALVGETIRFESDLSYVVRISSGQIASGPPSANQLPTFDGTRAYLLSLELPAPLPINNGTDTIPHVGNAGGVYTAPASALENEHGGPFWLYRSAIPEPSSLALLLLGGSSSLIWNRRR